MKITFLGTGTSQGVPVIACKCDVCKSPDMRNNRLRASIMIEVDESVFVIDAGPDFRTQMLREKVTHLDAIILTHGHKDHMAGLDDVRAFNFIQKTHMDVYAQEHVNVLIKNEFNYAFDVNKYPGVPDIILHDIANRTFKIKNVEFTPIEVLHFQLPIFGYSFFDFAYITDAKFITESEKNKLKGCKTLVLNALRKKEHISHYNLEQALAIINEVKPERAFLTHLSHQMGLHEDVEKELPHNVKLAFDGLVLMC